MADPIRKFECETIAFSGLKTSATKVEIAEVPGAIIRRSRQKAGPDKTQTKVIVLRLIEFFERDPVGFGDL
jgi:hypothetical protein